MWRNASGRVTHERDLLTHFEYIGHWPQKRSDPLIHYNMSFQGSLFRNIVFVNYGQLSQFQNILVGIPDQTCTYSSIP